MGSDDEEMGDMSGGTYFVLLAFVLMTRHYDDDYYIFYIRLILLEG